MDGRWDIIDSKVILFKKDRLDADDFDALLNELKLFEKLQNSETIVIKPNLTSGTRYTSGSGVVTNYGFLENLIFNLRRLHEKVKIYIAESSDTSCYACSKFEKQGYDKLVTACQGVDLLDLSRDRYRKVKVNGCFFKEIDLSETLLAADFYISLGVMKTHVATKVSGVLKNQFGCLPTLNKKVFHPFLSEVICDLNRILKIDLGFIEGNPALEGPGPLDGYPKEMNLILAGNDPVSIDAMMSYLMGFEPAKIAHIRRAFNNGLGEMSMDNIKIFSSHDKKLPPVSINELEKTRDRFRFISWRARLLVRTGLFVQRIGQWLVEFGHGMHARAS